MVLLGYERRLCIYLIQFQKMRSIYRCVRWFIKQNIQSQKEWRIFIFCNVSNSLFDVLRSAPKHVRSYKKRETNKKVEERMENEFDTISESWLKRFMGWDSTCGKILLLIDDLKSPLSYKIEANSLIRISGIRREMTSQLYQVVNELSNIYRNVHYFFLAPVPYSANFF